MSDNSLPKSFHELLRTAVKPVLVDFWAAWCGPCRMVSPVVERVSKEFSGHLLTIKINIDEKQQIASEYQIQSIPTIMLFKNGQSVLRLAGARTFEQLKAEVEKYL